MINESSPEENQIHYVTNFRDLVAVPFQGEKNAICWKRQLIGDYSEIVGKLEQNGNVTVVDQKDLLELQLSEAGQLAREIILQDYHALMDHGASPVLNLIRCYERDNSQPFFPTDVYSFHVDRSPVPTDTFLCTYIGDSSELVPNSQAEQKIFIPEIREELRKNYNGAEADFESFLSEHFFDLHYRAKPNANIISSGIGNLWRLAVDCPESNVLPCIHRAPVEKSGQLRLLLIC